MKFVGLHLWATRYITKAMRIHVYGRMSPFIMQVRSYSTFLIPSLNIGNTDVETTNLHRMPLLQQKKKSAQNQSNIPTNLLKTMLYSI